jgi:hypothetical protein
VRMLGRLPIANRAAVSAMMKLHDPAKVSDSRMVRNSRSRRHLD